jgi:hypothetical protein
MRKLSKSWVALAALFTSIICLSYVVWLQTPRDRYSKEVAQIAARPQELPAGVRCIELVREHPSIHPMVELGTRETPENKHLRQLIGEQDPTFLKTCQDYELQYRVLHQQLGENTVFATGSGQSGAYNQERGLAAFAEVLLARGENAQAQQVALDGLKLASRLRIQKCWDGFSLRLYAQSIALDTCEFALRRGQWNTEQLEGLAVALSDSVVPEDLAARCLEANVALEATAPSGGRNESVPGLRARQRRIYLNRAIETLHQLRGRQILPLIPQIRHSEFYQLLMGEDNWSLNNLPVAQRGMLDLKIRQGLDHLLITLKLCKIRTGVWPKDLNELKRLGYQPLAGFNPEVARWETGADRSLSLSCPLTTDQNDGFKSSVSKWSGLWILENRKLHLTQAGGKS